MLLFKAMASGSQESCVMIPRGFHNWEQSVMFEI